jgi:hypothetical protein
MSPSISQIWNGEPGPFSLSSREVRIALPGIYPRMLTAGVMYFQSIKQYLHRDLMHAYTELAHVPTTVHAYATPKQCHNIMRYDTFNTHQRFITHPVPEFDHRSGYFPEHFENKIFIFLLPIEDPKFDPNQGIIINLNP